MAKRVIKQYNERRSEILACAEKLFFIHGYDATPVDLIIETAEISKGTFYYYFGSKEELLDTLAIERAQAAFAKIDAIVFDNKLSALERMRLYFECSKSWKMENRGMLKALMKVIYSPSNIVLREKFIEKQVAMARPTLTRLIKQGVEEGVYTTRYAEDIAETIFHVFNGIGSSLPDILQQIEDDPEKIELLFHKMNVYQDILERILGAPEGSIQFTDREYLRKYLLDDEQTGEDQAVNPIDIA